jgi:chromosome partitioning protein
MSLPEVIVLVTSKGGAGKTTLARSLAAYWHILGHKPVLIDADPKRMLARRHDPIGPLGGVLVIEEPEERIGDVIHEQKQQGMSPIIIDTAGFHNRTTIRALVACDLAIIPARAAGEDADMGVDTWNLIHQVNETPERHNRPIKAVFILTMTINGTIIARWAREQLAEGGYPLLSTAMAHRVVYPEAGLYGLSPCITEPEGAAARDIAAIAQEIASL